MPKLKKKLPKICMVACEWENCQWRLDIEPSEYEIFSDHLKAHSDIFIGRLKSDTGTKFPNINLQNLQYTF